jgi:hypothetical protein
MKKYKTKRTIDKRVEECVDGGSTRFQCIANLEVAEKVRNYMDTTGCPSISQALLDLIDLGYNQFAIELVVGDE